MNSEHKLNSMKNTTDLPLESLLMVMSYLAPRELQVMSKTCKQLRNNITAGMVMTSALMSGDRTKNNFEALYQLTEIRAIHPASPLRLLEIANARFCEFCHLARVRRISGIYGVFICKDCSNNKKHVVVKMKAGKFYEQYKSAFDSVLSSPKFCVHFSRWRKTHDNLSEEHQFALANDIDICWETEHVLKTKDLFAHIWSDVHRNMRNEAIGPVLNAVKFSELVKFLADIPVCERGMAMQYFVNEKLKCPREDDNGYKHIDDAFRKVIRRANALKVERRWKNEVQMARLLARGINLAIEFVDIVKSELDNPILGSKVLAYSIDTVMMPSFVRGKCPINFRYLWVEELLSKHITKTDATENEVSDVVKFIKNNAEKLCAEEDDDLS